jgi:hypothetical protein
MQISIHSSFSHEADPQNIHIGHGEPICRVYYRAVNKGANGDHDPASEVRCFPASRVKTRRPSDDTRGEASPK